MKLAFCTVLVVHPLRSNSAAQISPEENDTAKVLEELTRQTAPSGILSVLSRIHGPWAFVFWQVDFGRSLLLLTNCTLCMQLKLAVLLPCICRSRPVPCGLVGTCLDAGASYGIIHRRTSSSRIEAVSVCLPLATTTLNTCLL